MNVRSTSVNADFSNLFEQFDRDGYIIIKNAIDSSELARLRDELEPHFQSRNSCNAIFFGTNTTRIEALLSKSKAAQNIVVHPTVVAFANHLLGKNCDKIQLNLTQGIRIHPGEEAQILHPDSALFPISHKPFEFVMNAIWAYSDFTKENGATQIVPGSHKWPENRVPEPHEIKYAEMSAGSVLLYAASLLHGGGANVTDKARTGIAIGYCLGWLRQSENQYLSYPLETVRTFAPELQDLLGYHVHRPNLGWVFGHNPSDLVNCIDHGQEGAEDFLTDQQQELIRNYRKDQSLALTNHNL